MDEKICSIEDPDNIGLRLQDEKTKEKFSYLEKYSVAKLNTNQMVIYNKIKSGLGYGEVERLTHFLINKALTEKGIAPIWRGFSRFKQPEKGSPEGNYSSDLQIYDLYWIYCTHHGHKVKNILEWTDIFETLFTDTSFNYSNAYKISRSELKARKKVELLRLHESLQEELAVIRVDKVRKKIKRIEDKADEIEIQLNEAGSRHPRRRRSSEDIKKCKNSYMAKKLAGSSNLVAIKIYKKISGDSINESTFRSKIKGINSAISSVE